MKNYIKKVKQFLYIIPILLLTEVLLVSCNNEELDIQQNFPFEVSVMPVPKDISSNETVEIRFYIKTSGHFKDNQYHLRYFQFDGDGMLRYSTDDPFFPNDSYLIPQKEFRLYYTAISNASQSFKIWITDSFDNEKEIEFQFGKKEKMTKPIF